ncbi:right-handed parallel beta-helix repeat-containing protein [Gracilimonas mengyeensis]|nr:right-handed parallel beta-helix repeat-containing protein [Gracilimonas mengyeensis]
MYTWDIDSNTKDILIVRSGFKYASMGSYTPQVINFEIEDVEFSLAANKDFGFARLKKSGQFWMIDDDYKVNITQPGYFYSSNQTIGSYTYPSGSKIYVADNVTLTYTGSVNLDDAEVFLGQNSKIEINSNGSLNIDGTVNGSSGSSIVSSGDLTFNSVTTLKDVEVIMENGGELMANGLTLDGEGLVFNSGSDGQITGSVIKNASRGIELNGNTTPLIEDNTIKDNSTGVWVNSGVGSGAEIIDNRILNNSTHGIASYYSSPTVEDNFIFDSSNSAFFGLGSTASITGNEIINANYGLYLLNGSAVQNISGNFLNSIFTTAIHVESPVTVVAQHNDILPSSGSTDYLVRAKYDATVYASPNFWSNATSGYFYATNGAQITYLPQSSTNYTPYYSPAKMAQKTGGQSSGAPKAQSCEETYQQVSEFLSRQSNEGNQRALLTTKAACWRASGKPGFIEYLNKEIRPGLSKKSRLYATTLELENLFLMDEGNYKQAIANYQILRKIFADDPMLHQQALFGLGYIYSLVNKDARAGGHYLAELQRRYPESSLSQQAGSLAEAYSFKIARLSDYEDSEEVEQSPEELSLSNYPNPFNPVTEISYSLPERSQVSLVVYDMLGRQVAELVNQSQSAGSHSVSFDASQLSSGIYLYRLQAGNKVVSGRMTLVK